MRQMQNIGRLVGLIALFAMPASAEQTPAPLLGHSVILNWTETRSWRPAGDGGVPHRDTLAGSASAYLGKEGSVAGKYRSDVSVNVQGKPVTNSLSFEGGHWRFDGHALVGDYVSAQGVMRISITFSNGFKDCSLAIIYGKPKGMPAFVVEGWMKEHYLLESASVTAQKCSVQEGNVSGASQ